MGTQRFRKIAEAKLKKKLRIKLTIKLLKSFYDLDFVTQTDPMVLGDFQSAQQLYHGSILRITNQILETLKSAAKIVSLLAALLIQFRSKEQIALLPVIATLVGIETFILPSMSRSCCLIV